MDAQGRDCNQKEEEMDMRKGPWTMEEDIILANYIAKQGEGRWNSLAQCAGLKRTGKSCRLRWLNYLRPDVRRGNITLEEQLLILELHSRWGNRWSKIAQYLPGRTDNEIKNYWRTRVQKHAKQLKCDVNSKQFKDTMRYVWMPRLMERIQAASSNNNNNTSYTANLTAAQTLAEDYVVGSEQGNGKFTQENSGTGASYDSIGTTQVVSPVSDMDCSSFQVNSNNNDFQAPQIICPDPLPSPHGFFNHGQDFAAINGDCWFGGDLQENTWTMEDLWLLEQRLCAGL